MKLLIMQCSPFPVTLSSLRLMFLSNLFSNTPSLRSFFNLTDQVSHPHKNGQNFSFSILLFMFLNSRRGDEILDRKIDIFDIYYTVELRTWNLDLL
jgi:hypothetical protein